MKAGSIVKLFSAGWHVPHVRPFPSKVSLKNKRSPNPTIASNPSSLQRVGASGVPEPSVARCTPPSRSARGSPRRSKLYMRSKSPGVPHKSTPSRGCASARVTAIASTSSSEPAPSSRTVRSRPRPSSKATVPLRIQVGLPVSAASGNVRSQTLARVISSRESSTVHSPEIGSKSARPRPGVQWLERPFDQPSDRLSPSGASARRARHEAYCRASSGALPTRGRNSPSRSRATSGKGCCAFAADRTPAASTQNELIRTNGERMRTGRRAMSRILAVER